MDASNNTAAEFPTTLAALKVLFQVEEDYIYMSN